ncbi:MAG: von Willebrand factor type A domain-containing protein [Myxococcales bacterium]
MKHSFWLMLGPALLGGMLGCSSGSDDSSNGSEVGSPAAPGPSQGNPTIGSSNPNDGNLNIGPSGGKSSTSPIAEPALPEASASGGASGEDPAVPSQLLPANPFVITQHDPLSTFAADADTASYDIFTRSVASGSLPPVATVRLEEFVNYFHYDYEPPPADAAQPFSISLAAAPALDPSTLLLRVGIRGRLPMVEKRPANLVFLIDTSGSMGAPNKLPLVQYTLTAALKVLDPTDEISIVTYAGSTEVALPPTAVAQADTIESVIAGLDTSGGTNGSSGIKLAYQQARDGFIEGGINHVLLCTDGDFNLGLTADEDLVDLITQERASGVTFTALGYGADSNDAMMEKVSDAGNGTYSWCTAKPPPTATCTSACCRASTTSPRT